jgi:tripartite-type tricarboxylate transporter receptor subunit TctC
VHPAVPANSVTQFIALARSKPGKLNFASSGTGSSLHLAAELLMSMANIQMTHVAYKGSSLAVTDLIGGQVDVFFDVLPSSAPHVKAGRIRALAITDLKRSPLFPDVPTMDEAGVPGYRAVTWNAVLAPAGTPKEVVAKLNGAVAQLLQTAVMKERFATIGTEPLTMTPEQFASFLRDETAKWSGVIRKAGIKLE